MLMSNYTAELLNLEDVIITGFENISEQLHIYLELPRTKHIYPTRGTATSCFHDYRMQTIKDIPLTREIFLRLRKRRYRCSCGKRFFEQNYFLVIIGLPADWWQGLFSSSETPIDIPTKETFFNAFLPQYSD